MIYLSICSPYFSTNVLSFLLSLLLSHHLVADKFDGASDDDLHDDELQQQNIGLSCSYSKQPSLKNISNSLFKILQVSTLNGGHYVVNNLFKLVNYFIIQNLESS